MSRLTMMIASEKTIQKWIPSLTVQCTTLDGNLSYLFDAAL